MRSSSAAVLESPTTSPLLAVVETTAVSYAESFCPEGRVPASPYLAQLRRSIRCGKAQPFHMLLAVSLAEADALEVPIGEVTAVYEQLIALVRERRRQRLEALGGATHAIAGPSILREIKRENRAEFEENSAEDDLLDDEEDPVKVWALLMKSAAERHEQDRRDARLHALYARLRLREAVAR